MDLSERPVPDEIDPDDLSLLELEDVLDLEEVEREAGDPEPAEEYFGETRAEDFDPLNRTGIGAWLRTDGGTYFLPMSRGKGEPGAYVLIAPGEEPNTWDVAWLAQKATEPIDGKQGDVTEHVGLSLEMACSWAEEVLEDMGGDSALLLAGKGKSWRYKKDISDAQRWRASRNGIEVTEGMNKGQLADLISEAEASRRIDPIIAFLQASR